MGSTQGKKNFPYLHGFSEKEQNRLIRQAQFGEYIVFQDIDFTRVKNLIEVGCGVGAQSEILLRRFPNINISAIDLNEHQLASLEERIKKNKSQFTRFKAKKMDATQMSFASKTFDGAFLCWILEHVPDPKKVLNEVKRVLKPGAPVVITEVMNSSFFLDPYSPHVWKFWMAFNDFQIDSKGDPFIGAKLGNLLSDLEFKDIRTEIKTWFYDKRQAAARKECIEHWSDLLLSAAPQLIESKLITKSDLREVEKELKAVRNNPDAVFFDSFIQAQAIR
jgi:ubiquinone/menaquinone biosynthesis C-methylase UbiE